MFLRCWRWHVSACVFGYWFDVTLHRWSGLSVKWDYVKDVLPFECSVCLGLVTFGFEDSGE